MFPSKSYLEMKTGSSKVKKPARSKRSQTNNANQLAAYQDNLRQYAANPLGSRSANQSAPNTPENKLSGFEGGMDDLLSQLGQNRLNRETSAQPSAQPSTQPSTQPFGSFLQQLGTSFSFLNPQNPRKKQRSNPYDKYSMGIR
jgi:hypothetical protein